MEWEVSPNQSFKTTTVSEYFGSSHGYDGGLLI